MPASPGPTRSTGRRRVVAIALGLSGALAACTLLVPLDAQQCATDDDCAGRGALFEGTVCLNHVCALPQSQNDSGPIDAGADVSDAASADESPWGCLDRPPQVLDPNGEVALTLELFNALKPITTRGPSGGSDLSATSYTPVPGITVTACNVLDPLCSTPVAPSVISSDAGTALVTVPSNFDGFFRLAGAEFLPATLYPGPVLADASTGEVPGAMLKTADTALLAGALGVPMQTDPEAGVGHAFIQVYDCFDRHGSGVQFKLDVDGGSQQVQWYTKNNLPSTTVNQTDTLGAGGVVNVPIGTLTVTASLADGTRTLGTINAVISAGGTTYAWVRVRTR